MRDFSERTNACLLANRSLVSIMHENWTYIGLYPYTISHRSEFVCGRLRQRTLIKIMPLIFFIWMYGTIRFFRCPLFRMILVHLCIMNPMDFQKNGLPTIVALDPLYNRTMGTERKRCFSMIINK